MPGVRVVTDSASDLTADLTAAHGITVVPLTIRFGDDELLDGRDLTAASFWDRCKRSPALPETAAPPPGAFQTAFEAAADGGADGVLCCTISSRLSATYQAALAGAEAAAGRVPVRVIDTRSVTMGQGLLCLAAAEAAAGGASLDAVARQVEDLIGRTQVLGVVDTLDHLQRGGRIGGAAALLGSLLSIKPVIELRDGLVQQESKQRTRGRSLDYLVAKVAAAAPLERLAVSNGGAVDVDAVVARLAAVDVAHELVVVDLGPVVGTHAGPGTIGVSYQVPAGSPGGGSH
ncbi:MAG: DegV family protein [Acidimicrobiales bacterium]